MSTLETSRAAFEAWLTEEGEFPRASAKNADGSYKYMSAHTSWAIWQAASKATRKEIAELIRNIYQTHGLCCADAKAIAELIEGHA